VYEVGLPALQRAAAWVPDDAEAARVEACFALIAAVEDTNILHRGGLQGLCFARRAAQSFLSRGGVARSDWRGRAAAIHLAFVARGLSPGGVADLLAMSLFVMQLNERRPG
jgi:triphosphoribosyl-dephospho-CoA synthase